jgi:hypothetical protein
MSNTSDHQQSGGDLKLIFFDGHSGNTGVIISSCVMPEVLPVVVRLAGTLAEMESSAESSGDTIFSDASGSVESLLVGTERMWDEFEK